MDKSQYVVLKSVQGTFDAVVAKVRHALMQQGFGVLTEIDLSGTFKSKLNVDWPRTIILGACNPPVAHRAMSADHDVAVFLPCNVVVREIGHGAVEVAAMNPEIIGYVIQNNSLTEVVTEVLAKIRTALDHVE